MKNRVVLRGGSVIDGPGLRCADVAIEAETVSEVGRVDARAGDEVVDVSGRLVLPGFIDAHSHADGLLSDPDVTLALLRQGVTTVIGGQDGVSYAPGDGEYASEYFAAINGRHPTYRGGGVAAYLASVDGTSALNAGYLVPAGTVASRCAGAGASPRAMTSAAACGSWSRRGCPTAPSACRPGWTTRRASSRMRRRSPRSASRSRGPAGYT